MKIGIYGGTFNPIHYGHLRTAQEVMEALALDRVIFIPAGETPFDKPDLVKGSHRYKMVQAAIEDNPLFKISAAEIKMKGKSYTVDTISSLKDRYRRSDLFFIIGLDAFLDLPLWKQPDRLLDLANIAVISRPGYRFSGILDSPYLRGISQRTLKELDRGAREMVSFDTSRKQKGYLINVTALDISASCIRKLITSGKNVKYLLPDSVKSYIISNNLYARQQ